jgi:predicted N-acetyltransferase YhbS
MVEFRNAAPADIPRLRELWQEAFGDSQAQIGLFFAHGFAPERSLVLLQGDRILSALYWFDCRWKDRKMAYLYAVATWQARRGRGLGTLLMQEAARRLREQGYAAALLLPGSKSLYEYYKKLGYCVCTTIREVQVKASAPGVLEQITPEEYAAARRRLLPENAVHQEGANLAYMASQVRFYRGEGCVLAAAVSGGQVFCPELLGVGDPAAVAGALGARVGLFRMPGPGRDFAMCLELQGPLPDKISYFGWAFD